MDLQEAIRVSTISSIKGVEYIQELSQHKNLTNREKALVEMHQLGLPLIDIEKFIVAGIDHQTKWRFNYRDQGFVKRINPRLAIARANWEKVCCGIHVFPDDRGGIVFYSQNSKDKKNVSINCSILEKRDRRLRTDVPLIPNEIRPEDSLKNYWIGFEAQWEDITPQVADPVLLKRVRGNVFGIVATWDMSQAEVEALRAARLF